jgi:hypothetical protein
MWEVTFEKGIGRKGSNSVKWKEMTFCAFPSKDCSFSRNEIQIILATP